MKRMFLGRPLAVFLILSLLISLVPVLPAPAQAAVVDEEPVPGPVVIYEAYGGGGNTGSIFKHDYIVLKNISDHEVSLDGWSLQYASEKRDFQQSNVTLLEGSIAPGGYYLIQQAKGKGGNLDLPITPHLVGKVSMGSTAFKLALANSTELVGGKLSENLVDYVGVGKDASEYLGEPIATITSRHSIRRKLNPDGSKKNTGNNKLDFAYINQSVSALDYLKEESSPQNPDPGSEETLISIAEARGANGDVTTAGIVTFVDGRNITIQDDTAGIVARLGENDASLALGDKLQVTGERGEYKGLEQVNVTDYKVLNTGNTLPGPKEVNAISDITQDLESQRILIKDVELGATASNNTPITKDAETITIFKMPVLSGISAGDTVNVTAVVSEYNNLQLRVAQAEDIERVSAGDPGQPPVTGAVTIAEARQANGTVTTAGFVTFVDGRNITIQDDTAGIVVRLNKTNNSIKLGDKLQATGSLAAFKGLLQLNESSYEIVSSGNDLPPAQEVSLADLENFNAAYESERILLQEVDLGLVNTKGNTLVSQNGVSLNIYKIPDLIGIDDYDKVNVTAIYSIYNNPQLRVAQASDVELVKSLDLEPLPPTTVEDPILPAKEEAIKGDYPGAKNISEVMATPFDEIVTVYGVATYFFGNALIIQDVIDQQIVGYQIYGPTESVQPGDIVVISGKHISYYGLPELSNVSTMKVIGQATPFEPQIITADTLNKYPNAFTNEYVQFNDVTLPDHKEGQIYFQDGTGTIQTYRAPAYPIGSNAGDKVHIKGAICPHNGTPQIRLNDHTDYIITNDQLAPFVALPVLPDAKASQDYVFYLDALDNVAVDKVTVTAKLGNVEKTVEAVSTVGNQYKVTIPGSFVQGAQEMTLAFYSLDINNNESRKVYDAPFTYGTSLPREGDVVVKIDDRPLVQSVSPLANAETGLDKQPLISVDLANIDSGTEVKLSLNDGEPVAMSLVGNKATYKVPGPMVDGKVKATLTVTRSDNAELEKPYTWYFTVGEASTNLYFGQIHSHTNYSDGAGTLREAMDYASKEAENLDFFAITDHSNYFDTSDHLGEMANENSGLMDSHDPNRYKWEAYKDTINRYNSDDFVALYGYEMTWTKSGANYGHINTYMTDGFVSRNHPTYNDKSESKGLLAYYDLLVQTLQAKPLSFSQFNHPGSTFGTFDDFAHYDPKYKDIMKLVEVGNGEGAVGSKGYWRSYQYYTMALDKGWKVAPSNNQDNHKGKWGDSNTTRTVVMADAFTQEGIIQAIQDLRVYATEDNNLEIDYTVNGEVMGSTLENAGDSLDLALTINDPTPGDLIGQVDIVTNGGQVLHTENVNDTSAHLAFTLDNANTYYYVRITQADGDIAVTAPVWTKDVVVMGIDSITKNTEVEYRDETLDLTTTFANGSDKAISLAKVTYALMDGNTQIPMGEETLSATVEPGDKGSFTHKISIPNTAPLGDKVILVTVTDAKGNAYTESISVTIFDKEAAVTPIADVHKAQEGQAFVIEGSLTSNTSGYDKNTAFFDSAYIQDDTGGINIFPISGNYKEGDKLRITGVRSSYQGEGQLKVSVIEEQEGKVPLSAKVLKTGDVQGHLGLLVSTEGKVTDVKMTNGIVDAITIDDGSGPIRVFIDGYIGRPNSDKKTMDPVKVGDKVKATGLSSIDPEGKRIRVRNRDDVVISSGEPVGDTEAPLIFGVRDQKVKRNSNFDVLNGISVRDNVDEKVSLVANPATLDTSRLGSTTVTVTATDAAGNRAEASFKVEVVREKSSSSGGGSSSSSESDSGSGPAPKPQTPAPSAPTPDTPSPEPPSPENPDKHVSVSDFTDVQPGEWYYKSVEAVVEKGLMVGVSETEFAPQATATRAMIVTLLHRLAGEPEAKEANSFADVDEKDWFAEPVMWAHETGLAAGFDAERFGPNDPVTREQLAAFLMRYAALKGYDVTAKGEVTTFTDAKTISPWAEETISWAVATGLMSGYDDGRLNPQGQASRAEIAAMIERFGDWLDKQA